MSAVDRALRHIEKLQKRLIKAMPSKPAKPGLKRSRKKRSAKPRVVSPAPRHKRPEPYNPPRSEPDFTELREAFAPPPPAYELSITAEGARAVSPMSDAEALKRGILPNGEVAEDWEPPQKPTRPSWADAFERAGPRPVITPVASLTHARGSCKAVDEDTGRQCRLPAHDDGPHRSERGAFSRVLQSGSVPLLRQRLDSLATRREGVDYSQMESAPVIARPGGRGGHLKASIGKHRKSAHAGDDTTTGLSSVDQGASQ